VNAITENLDRLAALLADGLRIPIQATYELPQAPEALGALGTTTPGASSPSVSNDGTRPRAGCDALVGVEERDARAASRGARNFVLPCRAGTTPGPTDTGSGPLASLLMSRSTSGLPVMLTDHWSSLQLVPGALRSRLLRQWAGV